MGSFLFISIPKLNWLLLNYPQFALIKAICLFEIIKQLTMKKTLLSIILITLGLIINAQITYVNINATGLNNGSSWANAYTDLHSATYNTTSGQIWVAQGTYLPSKNISDVVPTNISQKTFKIKFSVKVYGGFIGNETVLTQRDWKTNVTVLSGQLNGTTKAYNVVTFDANNNTTLLDGFTVENGQATGTTEQFGGAMMLTNSASPTIRNCKIVNNISQQHGGAIYAANGAPKFENCEFKNNHTNQYDGGALYVNGATSTTIVNCLFNGNSATRHGGCMVLINTTTSNVWNCTFVNNQRGAGGIGGVILLSATAGGPTMKVKNCIFYGNLPTNNGSIDLNAGTYTVTNCYSSVTSTLCFANSSSITNAVTGTPYFTDFANGDFTLLCNSPAVNKGDTTGIGSVIPSTDLNGNTRVRGTIDIGAYENPMTIQTSFVGIGISANQTGATYRWLNCNTGYSAIPGETSQTFTPSANGSYAVEVTLNSCSDTSACVLFTNVSVRELENTIFKLFPNPASNNLTVQTADKIETISIYNTLGALVQIETNNEFSVAQLPTGIYIIEIKTVNGNSTARFIKE